MQVKLDLSGLQSNAHRIEVQIWNVNERARKEFGAHGTLTVAEWNNILKKQRNLCKMCKKSGQLTVDHIFPLGAGGYNTKGNIQGLCWQCNLRKGNTTDNKLSTKFQSTQRQCCHVHRDKSICTKKFTGRPKRRHCRKHLKPDDYPQVHHFDFDMGRNPESSSSISQK